MRVTWLLVLAVAACSVIAGTTLRGTFTLTDPDITRSATSCSGTGGYSDVKPGMEVTVRNEGGDIVGKGSTLYESATADRCVLRFEVPGVPFAKFYTIEVGNRGDLTYSRDELDRMGWTVGLTLGS